MFLLVGEMAQNTRSFNFNAFFIEIYGILFMKIHWFKRNVSSSMWLTFTLTELLRVWKVRKNRENSLSLNFYFLRVTKWEKIKKIVFIDSYMFKNEHCSLNFDDPKNEKKSLKFPFVVFSKSENGNFTRKFTKFFPSSKVGKNHENYFWWFL